jgi:hypothetical protein
VPREAIPCRPIPSWPSARFCGSILLPSPKSPKTGNAMWFPG